MLATVTGPDQVPLKNPARAPVTFSFEPRLVYVALGYRAEDDCGDLTQRSIPVNTRDQTMTTTPLLMTSRSVFVAMKAPRCIAALGVLLATAMPALAQCPISFAAAANYAAGDAPWFVAVGDFNADGRPDLAVANPGSDNVSILLGNAPPNAGTFQARVNYAAGNEPYSVAVGDFNADGRPDLAVANRDSNNVSILRGNANGTFQAPVNYAVGVRPTSVALGDFNADGRPDLAVANAGSDNVAILRGNLFGTFQTAVNYAVGTSPVSVAVGDFNADGRPDVAVANFDSDNVSILRVNANGTFQAAVNYAVGDSPRSVAVGDFNADGRPDLAVANALSDNVSILRDTFFGTFQVAVNYTAGNGPRSVAVGDFNGDGQPDLAVANVDSDNVSILLGNAPPTAGTFQVAINYSAGSAPRSVAVGDFNADGKLDLAVAIQSSDTISVRLNTTPNEVVISQHPASVSTCSSDITTFSVITATGTGPLTYQWQWQPAGPNTAWAALVNGVNNNNQAIPTFNVSRATTPSMTIRSISGVGGNFRCIVTNACGSVTSNEATLTIIQPCGLADIASDSLDTRRCANGSIGPEDLDAFIAGFIVGNAAIADVASDSLDTTYNPNGSVGPEDLDAFIASFIAGC